jgi:hypothetical protein
VKYLPWVLLFVATLAYGCDQRRQGELKEKLKNLSTENDSLKKRAESLKTAYRVDTLRLRSIRRITDTLLMDTTAKVIPTAKVKRIVADERQACDAALGTLQSLCAVKDQQIVNLNTQIQTLKDKQGGWFRRTFGCAAGATASTQGAGLGATCGVKFP